MFELVYNFSRSLDRFFIFFIILFHFHYQACSNIFNSYFCDTARMEYGDAEHAEYIEQFDQIFWEVNNGRLVDFAPCVMPFMRSVMAKLAVRCATVRRYVLGRIVEPRTREQRTGNLLDSLLQRVDDDENSQVERTRLQKFSQKFRTG
jgi:hypothetical protein